MNCDMGERPEALLDGSEEELMSLITSANIACGYHAGDERTMEQCVSLAVRYGVGIGAHPGYPDRANFGRVTMALAADEISQLVFEQLLALGTIAAKFHADIVHAKPHGALYHDAGRDPAIANAFADGVAMWNKSTILVGFAGSRAIDIWI